MKPSVEHHPSAQGSGVKEDRAGDSAYVAARIPGEDPAKVYPPLGEVVQEIVSHFQRTVWRETRRKGDRRQIQVI